MVTVALWMVWVAPYVLRNRRQQVQAAAVSAEAFDDEPDETQAGVVLTLAPRQEKPMETMHSKAPASPQESSVAESSTRKPPATPFTIRYARLTLALAGLALLLTAIVSGALRLFGTGTIWLPLVSFVGSVLAVVTLRRLALRDLRERRARRAAPVVPIKTPARYLPKEPPVEAKETPVFDAEAGKLDAARLSAVELRQAALAVALAAGDKSVGDKSAEAAAGSEDASWEPVEVPKPTYVGAAKAQRPAPEPLDLPEAPKPVGKPVLKQSAEQAEAAAAAQVRTASKGQSALSNLDDVLQRRRA
ncbi:hypothetical protein [Paenarthrobacter aromaticivorans]|uniref:Transmembrane protein n=1 Tax=Paenarthrobacter aromaticivorans TaxID=2849150 RepID=A0ABS6I5N8_9MICC|nr:hypothetical protein [Paenarthrobacter sp. MMS21-TAE1-1]MBU8867026.1 hypothetical protein [Paenarthrobacter sp. MMS21-TAE1-1]